MPFVMYTERRGREMGLKEGRYEAIEVVLDLRFPEAVPELMPKVKQIEDMDRLHALLLLAKKATLADIQAAVSQPK